ncbi:hypothetical protein HDU76_008359 [Blyttiomyces sp. JEL0837]|nr:hypothetical protein HDU76_008359 [Blyttiomyces sp. JEL0837]
MTLQDINSMPLRTLDLRFPLGTETYLDMVKYPDLLSRECGHPGFDYDGGNHNLSLDNSLPKDEGYESDNSITVVLSQRETAGELRQKKELAIQVYLETAKRTRELAMDRWRMEKQRETSLRISYN